MWQNILAPTDFTSASDGSVEYAHNLARDTGATLHLLHVVAETPPGEAEEPGLVTSETRFVVDNVRHHLQQLRERLRDVPCETEVRIGPQAREIVSSARDSHADVIVMGTHGYRGFKRLLRGSVTDEVVRTADCPVISLRDQSSG